MIGLPDEDLGNIPYAIVELHGPVSDQDLMDHLRQRLAPHKLPRTIERATLPLGDDAGKVRRPALRAERIVGAQPPSEPPSRPRESNLPRSAPCSAQPPSQAEELDGVLPEDALLAGIPQRELVEFLDAPLEVQTVASDHDLVPDLAVHRAHELRVQRADTLPGAAARRRR